MSEADKQKIYYTPPNIVEFVMGSGIFLKTALDLIVSNPPFAVQKEKDKND